MTVMCAYSQEFLASRPGVYINRLDLLGGALTSSLQATARQTRADRLDLVFGDVEFKLGPLKFKQASRSATRISQLCAWYFVTCVLVVNASSI